VRRRLTHERIVDRPRAVDRELDHIRNCGGTEVCDHDERKRDRATRQPDRKHREGQPDDAVAPQVRERDEDRIERLRPVLDDPALDPLI